VSGSGISWVISKSAPRSRQITMPHGMPAPYTVYHSVFTGRMPFLPPKQLTASKHWRHFWCQKSRRNSNAVTPNAAVKCRWG